MARRRQEGQHTAGADVPTFRGLQPVQAGFKSTLGSDAFVFSGCRWPQGSITRPRSEMGRLSGKPPVPRPFCAPRGKANPIELNVNGSLELLQGHGFHATPPMASAPWKIDAQAFKKKNCLCAPGIVKTLNGKAYEKKGPGAPGALRSQSCPLWLSTTSCCVTTGNILTLSRPELSHLYK